MPTPKTEKKKTPQWVNGVGKRCREGKKKCETCPRCDHPWWIRVQYGKDRIVKPCAYFAFLLESHQQIPNTRAEAELLAAAVLTWLAKGRKMPTPVETTVAKVATIVTMNEAITGWEQWRRNEIRRKKKTTQEANQYKVAAARRAFGEMDVKAVTAEVLTKYVESEMDLGKEAGTPGSIIATAVRPVLYWCAAQDPPLIDKVPFGKYKFHVPEAGPGRDRRCAPDEEYELLRAAEFLNTVEYQFTGRTVSDFIILAIDLGARSEELFLLTVGDIDWHLHVVTLYKTKAKQELRKVPFNPDPTSRVYKILDRRRRETELPKGVVAFPVKQSRRGRNITPIYGSKAPVIASRYGKPVTNIFKGWVHTVCIANGIPYKLKKKGGYIADDTMAGYFEIDLRPHDLRHETATWLAYCDVPDEYAEFMQGHKRQTVHGRYKHEQLMRTIKQLKEKVWPREGERNKPAVEAAQAEAV